MAENLNLGTLTFNVVPKIDQSSFAKVDRDIDSWKHKLESQNPKIKLSVEDNALNDLVSKVQQKLDKVITLKVKGDFSQIEQQLNSLQMRLSQGLGTSVSSGQMGQSSGQRQGLSGFSGALLGGLGEAAILGSMVNRPSSVSTTFQDLMSKINRGNTSTITLGTHQKTDIDNLIDEISKIDVQKFTSGSNSLNALNTSSSAHPALRRRSRSNGFADFTPLFEGLSADLSGSALAELAGGTAAAGVGILTTISAKDVAQQQNRRQQMQDINAMSSYSGRGQQIALLSSTVRNFAENDWKTDWAQGMNTVFSTFGLENPMSRRESARLVGNQGYSLSDQMERKRAESEYTMNVVLGARTATAQAQYGATISGMYASPVQQSVASINAAAKIASSQNEIAQIQALYNAPKSSQSEITQLFQGQRAAIEQSRKSDIEGAKFAAFNNYLTTKAEGESAGYATYGNIRESISSSFGGKIKVAEGVILHATTHEDFLQANAQLDLARNQKVAALRGYDYGQYGTEAGLRGSANVSNLRTQGSFAEAGRVDIYNQTVQSVLNAKYNGYDPSLAIKAGIAQLGTYNQGLRVNASVTNIQTASAIAQGSLQSEYRDFEAQGVATYANTMSEIMQDRETNAQGIYHRKQLAQAGIEQKKAENAQLALLNFPGQAVNLGIEESAGTMIERNPSMLPQNIQRSILNNQTLMDDLAHHLDGSVLSPNTNLKSNGIDNSGQPDDLAGNIRSMSDAMGKLLELISRYLQ